MDRGFEMERMENALADFHVKKIKILKEFFKGKIQGSFLIEIYHRVADKLGEKVFEYFHFGSIEDILLGSYDNVDYEICRHIVGSHNSYMIFISQNERKSLERDEEYKEKLINQVIYDLSMRKYVGAFLKNRFLTAGDDFLYFPVPYRLSVICILITSQNSQGPYQKIVSDIMNKSLAVLLLLSDRFSDSAYSVCRGVIELYLKFQILKMYPETLYEHDQFVKWEIERNCCNKGFPEKFNASFRNRKNQEQKNKIDYLHYGWMDVINDIKLGEKKAKYSVDGLIEYLMKSDFCEKNDKYHDILELYKRSHVYVHGNVGIIKYSLLNYFEICMILYPIITDVYQMIQKEKDPEKYSDDKKAVPDFDLLDELEKNMQVLREQYERRSTELFEEYYGTIV